MEKLKLGKTGLWVTKVSFGALPIQRVDFDTAKAIFRRAYEAGINYFDTARGYTDSEAKIGYSLSDVRSDIIISTKSPGKTRNAVLKDIQTSLKELKTDYVDLLQLHNPEFDMDYDDENSPFAGLMEAKKRGYCRFTGVTQHNVNRAIKFVREGRFETMQFPFSCLASDEEIAL